MCHSGFFRSVLISRLTMYFQQSRTRFGCEVSLIEIGKQSPNHRARDSNCTSS